MQRTDNISIIQIDNEKINNPNKIAHDSNKNFVTIVENLMTILIKKEAVKLLYKCKNNIILEVKLIPTTETEGGD